MHKWIYPLMVIMLVVSMISITYALDVVEYDAIYTLTIGKDTFTQKLHFKNDKIRIETAGKNLENVSLIVRIDKDIMWILMDEQKMYMKQAVDPTMVKQYVKQYEGYEEKLTKIGSEKLLGYDCDIYELVEGKDKSKHWIVKGRNAVLRSIMLENGKEKMRMEATEISFRNQADSIFELPAGYQEILLKH